MTRDAKGNSREVAAKGPEDFPRLLEQSRGELAKVLPEGVKVERVMRMALTAYRLNPALRDCSPISILTAVMKAAELGLEPGGGLKQCWLIPYKNQCTFQLGYQGVLELARRSGAFRAIEARTVLDTDEFSLEYDPRPVIRHRPDLAEAGAEIGAYAYAVLAHDEVVAEWMGRRTLDRIRAMSKSQNIWESWYGEMAKRSVLKRLLKRQPASFELREALEADDLADRAEEAARPQLEAAGSRAAALGRRLQGIGGPAEGELAAAWEPPAGEEPLSDAAARAEFGPGADG